MFASGGKEILIKAVAQVVPAYAMSVFKLPKAYVRKFRVQSQNSSRGLRKTSTTSIGLDGTS